ncbi:beta-lactamase hydrolase-like protein [bacterium BMS3Bbin10]|nr:beta-lactamase hydrolase-like protein [bacterium BMS3Bbin10]
MPTITHITPNIATASQLDAADFAQIAALGFRSVINNRPDAEPGAPVSSSQARQVAARAGLSYAYLPAPGHALFDEDLLDAFDRALRELPGPVLVHCLTGTRSAILWALVTARTAPVEGILRILADAGLDIDFLEPQLQEQSAAHGRETDALPVPENRNCAVSPHAAIASPA